MKKNLVYDIKQNLKGLLMKKYNTNDLKEIGGYQNFIFSFTKNEGEYIVRVTDQHHRTKEELLNEVYFVNYLYDKGIPVSQALKYDQHDWVEEIKTENVQYWITLFEKAKGFNWYEVETDEKTYYRAGKHLGKIHRLSKALKIKANRKEYKDNEYLSIASCVIDDCEIIDKLNQFLEELNQLPKDCHSYGLIHGDYFYGNIIYDTDSITIIDFDECEHNWYIYDIAVYVYYYLLGGNPAQMDLEPNMELFKRFMKGYLEETEMDPFWIKNIQIFFKLRDFVLLSSIYRSQDMNHLSKWNQAFVDEAKKRIKNDQNFINIDFLSIYHEIINSQDSVEK